ncbi:TetR/AcrR family transcriptional regulator [Beijerinckia indica]|uniref:Transcriptional regulator, TetR family n=1 Tax=Beijerinckia indica subsp. indica (strain ATCC 9039 / DSM 1715 / NCIMB 8712) TaxID=395963 RepID=B2II23_BEII9|nr:TetR/AcrR family transcriptional regulator [Beijerinckia indica]ACB94606.1 transcriptional regulator, TetR family [Beijerinckia indica subsp. indica ATCC 9039]
MNATPVHTDVRQHILEIARPILSGKGFSAVGLNEILAAAGVPKGSFYHYFPSKEAFGEALLEQYFTSSLAQIDTLLTQPGGTAADRLMRYWQNWLNSQASSETQAQCLAVKLGAEVCDLSEPMRTILQDGTMQIVRRLARCMEEARADGSLPDLGDSQHMAMTLYQLWLGASLLAKFTRDPRPFEEAMITTRKLLNLPAS